MIDISEFGVPQTRKRYIMVGVLQGKTEMFFDILYKRKKDFLKKKGLNEKVSVGEAIGDLLKENGTLPTPDFKNYVSAVYGEIQSNYQKLMRKGLDNMEGCVADSHRFAKHSEETKRMMRKCYKVSQVKAGNSKR